MLGMKIVIAAVLRTYELRPAGGGPELARRRNITVRPHLGSRVALGARERIPAPA